ncbi:MAG: thioesterase family protein [Bacteroidales bacterium]
MKQETLHISTEKVTDNNTAIALGSGNLSVYATPAMVALMEKAAKNAVIELLKPGETTVGAEIHIKHIKPSIIGANITATAKLALKEGHKLSFTIEAKDEKGIIGNGTHIRYIVEKERFMQRAAE